MNTIKLGAVYKCHPLWEASPGRVGNIPPESLPLSDMLITALNDWASSFEKTLKIDDPAVSGFASQIDAEGFQSIGLSLANQLQHELGTDYEIILGTVFRDTASLLARPRKS